MNKNKSEPRRVLVLFPNEWDQLEFAHARFRERFRFFYEGFDLFKFPENAKLMTFNAPAFIEKMVAKYRNANLAAVVSSDEQIGSLVASNVAQRLGLPGPNPHAVLIAQHKYYSRKLQASLHPEATPKFFAFPYTIKSEAELGLPFPFFVKPVKATYSILARRVDDFADLMRLINFGLLETQILKKLVQPCNDMMRAHPELAIDALHLVGEELVPGVQVTIDGFADRGEVTVLGAVDSVMYPHTQAFERFEYPSRLPEDVQARMRAMTRSLVSALGLGHGAFNVEFFYQADANRITFLEINPRVAYQFADLYEKVDGFNLYDVILALALGETPRVTRGQGAHRHAASFVLRDFAGSALTVHPSEEEIRRIREQYDDARVQLYIKRGSSLAREMKWLGSYRYAVFNLGGSSVEDLHSRYRSLRSQLRFSFN
jgi:biotin carboxylase